MFHLVIATPEKVLFDGTVKSLIAPGKIGYLEILTDHAPIITSLQKGKVTGTLENGSKFSLELNGGLLEVSKNNASLLADEAENVVF